MSLTPTKHSSEQSSNSEDNCQIEANGRDSCKCPTDSFSENIEGNTSSAGLRLRSQLPILAFKSIISAWSAKQSQTCIHLISGAIVWIYNGFYNSIILKS